MAGKVMGLNHTHTSTGTDEDPRISADVGQRMFLRQGSIPVSQVK